MINLKAGKFTYVDASQTHFYLNYAREHWSQPDENPPGSLIFWSKEHDTVARLPSKGLVHEYLHAVPDEKRLAVEMGKTRQRLGARGSGRHSTSRHM